ncbi:hypothetical protein ACFLXC_07105 [Chloroflexota bacterium]
MAKVELNKIKELMGNLESQERGATDPYPSQVKTLQKSEEAYALLVPFETQGRYNLLNKYSQMRTNYRNTIPVAKANYDALPFGPKTKQSFKDAMDENSDEAYNGKLVVSHEKKWANKWMKGVSR